MRLKPGYMKLAASPLFAFMASVAAFFTVFIFLGQNTALTFVLVALSLFGLAIVARPERGLYLLVIHLIGGLSQYFELPRVGPLSITMALEGLLVLGFLFQLSFFKRRIYLNLAENWFLGGYLVLCVLSLVVTTYFTPDNFDLMRRQLILHVIVYFLLTNLIDTPDKLRRLLASLLTANVLLVGSGILYHVGLITHRRVDVEAIEGRTVGFLGNPNGLAFTLIGLFPLAFGLLLNVQSRWGRALLVALLAGDVFIILNTLSRGGFISLVLVLTFLTYRLGRDRRLVVLLLVFGIVVYLILPSGLFERFEEMEPMQGNTRYVLARIGLNMVAEHPFLGVGYGNYRKVFLKYDTFNRGGSTATHNMYVNIAAQTGVPSLLLFLGFVATAWSKMGVLLRVAADRSDRRLRLLATSLQAGLVNVLVFGITGDVHRAYLTFILIGLCVVVDRIYRREPATAVSSHGAAVDRLAVGRGPA